MELSVKNVCLGAAAIAAAAAAFCFLNPSEEGRVKAAFKHAAELVSKEADESLFVTATKTRSIAEIVESEIEISIPEQKVHSKFSRNELVQQVAIVRKACASLSVAFESVTVESIDGDVARATADLLVSGSGTKSFLQGRDTREFEAVLKKSPVDDKWRFSSVAIKAIVSAQ